MIAKIGYTFLILCFGLLAYINIRLHGSIPLENEPKTHKDLLLQLNFIEKQLKEKDLAVDMQLLYPEGYVFSNVLYGLAWLETVRDEPVASPIRQKAIGEATYAYTQLETAYAKSVFYDSLSPRYGVFYAGWKNYLLGKKLVMQRDKMSQEAALFQDQCQEIAQAFTNSPTPFLQSYVGAAWAADSFVAIASLQIHDSFFEPQYQKLIADWLTKVKAHLDPKTGLLPHASSWQTGEVKEGTRGSSMALALLFLAELDKTFAQEQFLLFQKHFSQTICSLPSIREYPEGSTGQMDVDSGLIVFDMGLVATIVSVGVFQKFGEYKTANNLFSCIETFGLTTSSQTEKSYLWGKMPMADIFIVWVRAQKSMQKNASPENSLGSVALFHIWNGLALLLMAGFLSRRKLKNIFFKTSKT